MTQKSDRYAVVGNPVSHSRSPAIHARFAALTGQALDYGRIEAPLDGFADTVRAFFADGGAGCNVTVPFKFDAPALADVLAPRAALAGAANTLLRTADGHIAADNTDGAGLVADIEIHAGVPLAGLSVLLVGAGGAGAGVLGPLLAARPAALHVANRTASRADALVRRHAGIAGACTLTAGMPDAVAEPFDVVVNATAASLGGGAAPFPAAALRPGTLAVDLMYGPAARPFLAWAAQQGAVPRDGLGMLVEQAAEAFRLWRGVRPPTAEVLAALRAEVDAA